jgi:hypothetical protein
MLPRQALRAWRCRRKANLCNVACELDGMTVGYGGRYYTCRRHTQPRLRRRGPTATVRVLMRVLIVPVHECPGVSRDVGQAHHSAHHLRIHGRGETVLDWLPQAGGQGVAGSNPVSPTDVMSQDIGDSRTYGCRFGCCSFLGSGGGPWGLRWGW